VDEILKVIPNKNGMVRWYLIGREEGVYAHLGWYDMSNWHEGWEKVWADAKELMSKMFFGDVEFDVLRHDQLEDLSTNVQSALFEAMENPDKNKLKEENT